jgi:hypothetical protein
VETILSETSVPTHVTPEAAKLAIVEKPIYPVPQTATFFLLLEVVVAAVPFPI